jgi:membrane-associated phospholipid phosphatase
LYFVALTFLTTLFAAIVPLCILIVWARRTNAHDMDVPARTDRNLPLLLATVSYFVGTAVLLIIRAPLLSTAVMFGYFAGTLFIFLVNLRWKISIHTMGIAGPTTVLVYVFGYWGALLGLLLPPVIWSRVYLKKHTLAQALAGAVVGFLLTAFALWLVLSFGLPYAPP